MDDAYTGIGYLKECLMYAKEMLLALDAKVRELDAKAALEAGSADQTVDVKEFNEFINKMDDTAIIEIYPPTHISKEVYLIMAKQGMRIIFAQCGLNNPEFMEAINKITFSEQTETDQ